MATRGVCGAHAGGEAGAVLGGSGHPHMVAGRGRIALLVGVPHSLGPTPQYCHVAQRTTSIFHGGVRKGEWLVQQLKIKIKHSN
jgi:DNA helicase TIP49 (TBP-interacting protein)